MKDERHTASMPLMSTRLTAVASVAMVLLLGGIAAFLGVAAHRVAEDIRQQMGFVVVMDDGAGKPEIESMKQRFTTARYVSSYTYSSPEDVLAKWQQMLGEEENISALLDTNPFAPEFEVNVKSLYASTDSLNAIAASLRKVKGVETVEVHNALVDNVNSMVTNVTIVLLIVAGVLLIVSCVLINNTVRLTVYARRFTIYTMRLVGATGGFIRRPLIMANIRSGIYAALVADALLAAGLWYGQTLDASVALLVDWCDAGWIMGALVVCGVVICGLTAFFAVNRNLRISRDDMYRR